MKLRLDQASIDAFSERVRSFVKSEATPSEYDKKKDDQQENEMQIHFARYMSQYYDVLREVSIPACGEDGTWEIDESMKTTAQQQVVFYTEELKFHGKGMSDSRQYADEAIEDIKRMVCVSNKYYDVLLGGICFITCEPKEADEVYTYARRMGLIADIEATQEKGYVAVVVTIVPDVNRDHTAPLYTGAWRARLDTVKRNGTEKENYFPFHIPIKEK